MATAAVDNCRLCASSFNSDIFQSVSLPCDHDFCLFCLVHLRANGKNNCPTCHRNWALFNVPALPEIEAIAASIYADQEDKGVMDKKKCTYVLCEKHSRPFEYWVNDIQEFHCIRCTTENPPIELELIEDVLPKIKAALEAEIPTVEKKVQNNMELLDGRHAELVRHRNTVRKFLKAVKSLDDNLKREIEEIVVTRSKAMGTTAELKNVKRKLDYFRTDADIHVAVECKSILKRTVALSSVPTSYLPKTLLCNIAHSYVEEAASSNPPCKTSFVYAVQKCGTRHSQRTVVAAERLEGGKTWTVDNDNCDASLLALYYRQPSVLSLVARDDSRADLLVAEVAIEAKGCEVQLKFLDTFYSADNSATDAKRLEHLTANQSLLLLWFYGHLDHSAIAKLPHTITRLGLAIGSAADAAAVSGLRPWQELKELSVSVSSRVTVHDLKPLASGPSKCLYFPFLSDAGVQSVKPAIEALAPDLRISSLYFPKCQLTSDGARQLTEQLRGVMITDGVVIETSGTWRPGAEEKGSTMFGLFRSLLYRGERPVPPGTEEMESIEAELRSGTGCSSVDWDMDWIYC